MLAIQLIVLSPGISLILRVGLDGSCILFCGFVSLFVTYCYEFSKCVSRLLRSCPSESVFPSHFFIIVVEVKTSVTPHVLKLYAVCTVKLYAKTLCLESYQ